MMILRLERGCQSTEMGQWTHPAGKGWDGGLSLLGRAGMRGLAVEEKQTGTSWGGISRKNILITNKEKWEIYC